MLKRIRYLIYINLLYIPFIVSAGDKQADSLITTLNTSREDSAKVNTLLQISKYYLATDPVIAIRYSIMAGELAKKLNFKRGIALSFKNAGLAYYTQGNYIETLNNWQQSAKIFEAMGDKAGMANMLNNQGAVYFNQGDDAKSLDLYLKALKISEEINDTLRIVTALINVGAVYSNKKATYEKALTYYLRALPLSIQIKDNYSIGTTTVNLGELYFTMGNDTAALNYFIQSLKAYEGSENIPYSLNDIGKVYLKRKEYDKAIAKHQEAFSISAKLEAKLESPSIK